MYTSKLSFRFITIFSFNNISLYALFVAILVPTIKDNYRIGIVVAITAVLNCVLQVILGSSWTLIVSILIGAFIGMYILDDEDLDDDCGGDNCKVAESVGCDVEGGSK